MLLSGNDSSLMRLWQWIVEELRVYSVWILYFVNVLRGVLAASLMVSGMMTTFL